MNFIQNIINSFKLFGEKEDNSIVITSIEKGIVFKGTNLWILIFAIFIASLGLNVNSTAVIIGAMLISPLMGPIMGIGLSLGINDLPLLRKSIYNYGFATIISLITSTLYFILSPISDAHSEILARTQPNIYDVLIAFFGGLAGVLANSSKQKGNVIPGVAIATALMPPLCTAGFGLATMQWSYFFGAFYLFLINTVFIALATLITIKYLKFPVKHLVDAKAERKNKQLVFIITMLTILPSIYFGYQFIQDNRFIASANSFIEKHSKLPNEYLLNKKINAQNRTITLVYGGSKLTDTALIQLQDKFKSFGFNSRAKLEVKQGFAYLNDEKKDNNFGNVLSEKDANIIQLQNVIDSLSNYTKLTPQLFKEAKANNSQIQSLSLQQHNIVSDSISSKIPLCFISTLKPLSPVQIQSLQAWIKVRINADSVIVINK